MSRPRTSLLVIGALFGAVLMSALPAVAKAGDNLILGTDNSSGDKTTELESTVEGGPGFKVENDAGGVWAASRINVGCLTNDPEEKESCAPGFATDTAGRVKHFNADKLDGLHADEIVQGLVNYDDIVLNGDSQANLPDENNSALAVDIKAPGPGVIYVSSTVSIDRAMPGEADYVECTVRTGEPPVDVPNARNGIHVDPLQRGICANTAAIVVDKGTHHVEIEVFQVAPGTELRNGWMTTFFLPAG